MRTYDRYLRRTAGFRALRVALLCAGMAVRAQDATAQSPAAQPAIAPTAFHEEVIAQMTPNSEYKDGLVGYNHVAWVEQHEGKRVVMLDGKQQGGTFDDAKELTFSPDETRLAFFAKRGSVWMVVTDGQEHPQRYTKFTSIAFQPKGNSYASSACQEKKCRLAVDGAETGGEYEDISFPQYSPDGKHLAFFGKRAKKWIAIVDGKELGPELDEFWGSSWDFTSDSSRFFAAARIKNDWMYVVDGTPGPSFGVISYIAFSRDGKHYAYAGTIAKGGFTGFTKQKTIGSIVLDGQTIGSYEGRGMGGALKTLGGTTESLVTGVQDLTPDFHGVSTPGFSPEGKVVYAARRDKGDVAVFVGDAAGAGFDEILSPVVFSETSGHFAYVAKRSNDFVAIRDNQPGTIFTPSKHGATEVQWISIGEDGNHLAFEMVSGGQLFKGGTTARALRSLVLDGIAGPEYNALGLARFNFDNKAEHYCYEVVGAMGRQDLVNVDGHESRLYDEVSNARISADGKSVVFTARDGARFLRVTYAL
jgi:hypothetical protein